VLSGSEIIAVFELWTRTHIIWTLQGAFNSISFILAFFVPILAALTFGRDIDTGTFRTFLSYPISRRQLFFAKEFLILVVICGTTSISYFVALLSFEPNLNPLGLILLYLVTLWTPALLVSLATGLIAVLSKSLSASLFGGVALSFGMVFSPFLFRSMDALLVAILNPAMAVSMYIVEDYSISILQSLSVGIITSLAISVLLLVVTLKQINRMEV
jgi:ABC-type transport system involved in multi-copper enzyme maturation permease subunit